MARWLCILLVASLSGPVLAGSAVSLRLKTATFAVTQERIINGVKSTVTLGRYAGFVEAVNALKAMPHGSYRITVPSPYVEVVPCHPQAVICAGTLDPRLVAP